MKKLLFLFMLPALVFSQEDIERYKVYPTENIYTSLLLDTALGKIWQLQIGIGDTDSMKTVLSDVERCMTIDEVNKYYEAELKWWEEEYSVNPENSAEDIELNKPKMEDALNTFNYEKNGKFKLYPTGNMYNFIMVDVESGNTWQVQWSTEKNQRLVLPIY